MRLVDAFCQEIRHGWDGVYAQCRTLDRAIEHAVGMLSSCGRRTITRTICAVGRQNQDWSADYKFFSRSPWDEENLFIPVMKEYLNRYPSGPISAAVDDTRLHKTGKKIKTATWQYDPMSPPFHTNLMFGLRFIQASLLFPHHREGNFSARGFPIRFKEAPVLKKPGKRATDEQRETYRQLYRSKNLSSQTLEVIKSIRKDFDLLGAQNRLLIVGGDGSLCNRIIFRNIPERTHIAARCRKDARLCFPAQPPTRRIYGKEKFTPEEILKNKCIRW